MVDISLWAKDFCRRWGLLQTLIRSDEVLPCHVPVSVHALVLGHISVCACLDHCEHSYQLRWTFFRMLCSLSTDVANSNCSDMANSKSKTSNTKDVSTSSSHLWLNQSIFGWTKDASTFPGRRWIVLCWVGEFKQAKINFSLTSTEVRKNKNDGQTEHSRMMNRWRMHCRLRAVHVLRSVARWLRFSSTPVWLSGTKAFSPRSRIQGPVKAMHGNGKC